MIQMLKMSAGLSPMKMGFVSTKGSLIKDSEKVRRWAAGQGMENKQTNEQMEKVKSMKKEEDRSRRWKQGRREGERIDRAYCWLQSISSPDLKWILHLHMEKVLTLGNTPHPEKRVGRSSSKEERRWPGKKKKEQRTVRGVQFWG